MFILDSDQLEAGLRFFDIIIRHVHDELLIYHGPISQHNCLDNVVEELVQFLEIHPTEFVLFRLVNYVADAEGNATVADPGFPRGGGVNSRGGGAPTYDFAKISPKLHGIERIWTPRRLRVQNFTM